MAALHLIKDKKGKIGYEQTDTHEIVIAPQFDEGMETFGSNSYQKIPYASVLLNSKCGIINEEGKIVVPLEYGEAYYLFDNLFAVRIQNENNEWRCGVINDNGEEIVPLEYEYINYLGKYIQCFKKSSSKRKYSSCWMDSKGRIYEYSPSWSIVDNEIWYNRFGQQIYIGIAEKGIFDYLVIRENQKLGLIDALGKKIIPCCYEEIYGRRRNRFIVCQKGYDGNMRWGVVNSCNEIVIKATYKFISIEKNILRHEGDSFFQCFTNCTLEREGLGHGKYRYYASDKRGEVWYNLDGLMLHDGKGELLSDNFLAVCSNGKWGCVNQKGERIINYMYDCIDIIQDKLIVAKDKKVGVLDRHGVILINPSYHEIECVSIQEGTWFENMRTQIVKHGRYNKECVFDTDNLESAFLHKKISINNSININAFDKYYDFEKIFILKGNGYSELFSIRNGIIPQSRFDEIQILTNNLFAVRMGDKWGVLSAMSEGKLLILCNYDRIIFEGGDVVLLCLNKNWGAKSLHDKTVDITPIFEEIKILNDDQSLFGVRLIREENESENNEYTIVDSNGDVYKHMEYFHGLETQFTIYNLNRILTSQDGKFGFISINGYIAIPFIYDQVEIREDGLFDVMKIVKCDDDYSDIETKEAWGVLSLSGKEVVNVKYTKRIPTNWSNTIVIDSFTGRNGILSANGTELVPAIYEHLIEKSTLYYFGFGGYKESEDNIYEYNVNNFFSYDIHGAKWGCMDKTGKILIDAEYDCFKRRGTFILAGRGGLFLGEGQHGNNYRELEYSGVYDLFEYTGKLIIGGFSSIYQDDKNDLFVIQYGGHWKQDCEDYDEWGNSVYYYSYHFEKSNSRWLVLDKGLRSVMKTKKGERHQFREGFLGTITQKEEDGKIVNYWNMPLELFSIKEPSFSHNLMICGEDYFEWVVRITDGLASHKHNQIHVIDENLFFFMDEYDMGSGVGIAKLDTDDNGKGEATLIDPIVEGTCVLTYPIGGYVFGVWNFEDDKYMVKLYNILKPDIAPIIAIKCIEEEDLMKKISRGYFMITLNEESEGYSRIMLPIHEIFDEEFRMLISQKETGEIFPPFEECYWYTDGQHLIKPNDDDDYNDGGYRDDSDYMRDSWDAMTDGMYGDMPDGFDGDYDFLGR